MYVTFKHKLCTVAAKDVNLLHSARQKKKSQELEYSGRQWIISVYTYVYIYIKYYK